ncbi:Fic family protein [Anaerosinus massiliensis]|uniref:Fic family protein n=1 Tax=Massilibacillus massiliensis TaxID=1806837 RepID=UPI000B2D02AF|nr:Fic family protein [Massilibacillus massiliensis]
MNELLQKIDELQKIINSKRPLNEIEQKELKDYFAIGLTYSSNALEGNSLTISETKVVLEDGLTVGGKPLKDILEAVGHKRAYDFMYSLTKEKTISEENIKRLHKLFYQGIDEKNAGVYRQQRVFISGSEYSVAPHDQIDVLMPDMVNKLNKLRAVEHPVVFAAKLHQKFVYIHPFVDGNGRVARLLMNMTLLQDGYPIVVIPPICRSEYISALEKGHENEDLFIQLIMERVVEAQRDYIRLIG